MHSHDKVRPGITMDEIVALRRANPGGGPHSMTGPDLRQRRRAGRRDGDPDRQDRAQAVRDQLQPARQGFPDDRRAGARDARRVHHVLHPRSARSARPSSSRGSRSTCSRSPARSPSASIPTTRRRARAARRDPMAPVSTLRPWKNGSNMDINELQRGLHDLHPGLRQGRARSGRATRTAGRATARSTSPRSSARIERSRSSSIVRKDMKLEWPRIETKTALDHDRLRRGSQQGDGQRRARGVDFLEQQQAGADEPLRGVLAELDGRRLPVSQVVDVRKGVHCMIPKSIFTKKS